MNAASNTSLSSGWQCIDKDRRPCLFRVSHKRRRKDVSKGSTKTDPEEKVGIVGIRDGHLDTIEYSELSKKERYARNPDGTLKFGMGSPAIYLLDVDFVEKNQWKPFALPYHKAVKKVPCIDENGCRKQNQPETMPSNSKCSSLVRSSMRESPVIMEVVREDEFSPVKMRQAITHLILLSKAW